MHVGRNKPWTEETERKLAKQLQGFFHRATFHSGFELFRSGYVTQSEWENDSTYKSVLSGGGIGNRVEATVQFDFLPFSRCTCKSKGSCAHMAAAVCDALFSINVSVFDFVGKHGLAKSDVPETGNPYAKPSSSQTAQFVEPPRTARSPVSAATFQVPASEPESIVPAPWDGYRKWHRLFEKRMPIYTLPAAQYGKWVDHYLLRVAQEWEDSDLKTLYRLHALLYAFRLADLTFFKSRYYGENVGAALQPLWDDYIESLRPLHPGVRAARENIASYFDGLIAMVGEYAFAQDRCVVDWLDLYRGLWRRFQTAHALQKEKTRLSDLIRNAATSEIRIRGISAMAHLLLEEEGDEAAVAYVKENWHGSPSAFFVYVQAYRFSADWKAMRIWLDGLQAIAAVYGDAEDAGFLAAEWKQLAEADLPPERRPEEFCRFLEGMLPASFESFTEVLLEQGKHRDWVDLHLAYGQNPKFSKGYSVIERSSPQFLLAYHHIQAAEWIETRNRDGYENAVEHMKRLRILYGKLNQNHEFRRYIQDVLKRYARLKALHDAMRKGFVIPK